MTLQMEECPKCKKLSVECGYGLAGGGCGPYFFCTAEPCDYFEKFQDFEMEDDMTDASQAIHPAPSEFTAEELQVDAILRYFHYAHLPQVLQERSKPFCDLARHIINTTPRNAERTVALRKLLEAKDAGVRAALP